MESWKASGLAEAESSANYILDWLAGSGDNEKILIFAHHKDVLDIIEEAVAKALKGNGHIRIDGRVSPQERQNRVHSFQSKRNIRVAILSITAAGAGLTLTAASTVYMAELHWTPGAMVRAEDRVHRIGQKNSVNIIYSLCNNREVSKVESREGKRSEAKRSEGKRRE